MPPDPRQILPVLRSPSEFGRLRPVAALCGIVAERLAFTLPRPKAKVLPGGQGRVASPASGAEPNAGEGRSHSIRPCGAAPEKKHHMVMRMPSGVGRTTAGSSVHTCPCRSPLSRSDRKHLAAQVPVALSGASTNGQTATFPIFVTMDSFFRKLSGRARCARSS